MNEEFDRYYNELADAYDSKRLFFTRNTDCLHNAAIMLLMLKKGTRISMYCGAMSVFKNGFYTNITNEGPDADNQIKQRVSNAFRDFISRDGTHIDILLEREPVNLTGDLIFDKSLLTGDTVDIYQIPDAIRKYAGINHYSFIDDSEITRIESDARKHTAICKIGTDPDVESPAKSFEKLRKLSRRVPARYFN